MGLQVCMSVSGKCTWEIPDEWTNLGEYSAVKKRLAAKLPQQEAPIVMDGLEGWSIPVSADKPLAKKSKTRPNQKMTSNLERKRQ